MRDSCDVYLKTAACCLALAALVWTVNLALAQSIHDPLLRLAIAIVLVQALLGFSLGVYVGGRRAYSHFHKGVQEQISPAIEERVMALALDGEAWFQAVPTHGMARVALDRCVAHALAGLKDSSRDRLARFAVEQGLAGQWERNLGSGTLNERKEAMLLLGLLSTSSCGQRAVQRTRVALHDKHISIRIEAARALLRQGEPNTVCQVFRSVLTESALTRTLLCGELKRHAGYLLAKEIPAVLESADESATANCLQLLAVWRLALPLIDARTLLMRHSGRAVLPFVLEMLPYCRMTEPVDDLLLKALESEDVDVQCATAQCGGRLKLKSLVPALLRLADSQDVRLAGASAAALAQMGAQGIRSLETLISGADRRAAASALEALEHLALATA